MATSESNRTFNFADFNLNVDAHSLTRVGERVELPPLSFKLLCCLAEAAPDSVSRQQLIERLWPDRVVGDETLTERVKLLRQAIEVDATDPRIVLTERGWGYRLTADSRPATARESSRPTSKWLLSTAVVVLLGVLAYLGFRLLPDSAPEAKSLAVLPLEILTGDTNDGYLAGSVTEELRTLLGRQDPDQLLVLGRSTSEHLAVNPDAVVELDVDYLLEGSVRVRGNQKIISLSLVHGNDRRQWWRDDFVINEFSSGWQRPLVNEVAIVLTLDIAIEDEPDASPAAWDAYLRGRHAWRHWTQRGFAQALSHFERSLQAAPEFSRAHSGMADALTTLVYYGALDRDEHLPRARLHAEKSLRLAPDSPLALTSNAMLELFFDHQPQKAAQLLSRARQSAPANPDVLLAETNVYWSLGCRYEAISAARAALRIDPYSAIARTALAWSLLLADEPARALEHGTAVLGWQPDFGNAIYVTAMAAGLLGRAHDAIDILRGHDGDALISALGFWQAKAGRIDEAQALMNREWSSGASISRARLLFALGDQASATRALDQALRDGQPEILFANRDPSLRDIPRSEELEAVLSRYRADCSSP